MDTNRILSSLSYFSVLFAPFLFPILVFILASGDVRHHAGKALWTHIVPYLAIFIGLAASALNYGDRSASLIIICIFTAIAVCYFMLNFVRGIKILIENWIAWDKYERDFSMLLNKDSTSNVGMSACSLLISQHVYPAFILIV